MNVEPLKRTINSMAFFQYRAADQAGKVVEGVMEADAEQAS